MCVALAPPPSAVAGLTAARPECFWPRQRFGQLLTSSLFARPLDHSSQPLLSAALVNSLLITTGGGGGTQNAEEINSFQRYTLFLASAD